MPECTIPSPQGPICITQSGEAIVCVTWGSGRREDSPLLAEAERQLTAYFAGDLKDFDLPLAPSGSPFQKSVWDAMLAIPYGKTRTYGDLAQDLGSVARAVGGACGSNPIPIIIPCHRVLAAAGELGGFSGGEGRSTKTELLVLEGALKEQLSFF